MDREVTSGLIDCQGRTVKEGSTSKPHLLDCRILNIYGRYRSDSYTYFEQL
jgi:hypothetical protein